METEEGEKGSMENQDRPGRKERILHRPTSAADADCPVGNQTYIVSRSCCATATRVIDITYVSCDTWRSLGDEECELLRLGVNFKGTKV